MYNIKAVSKLLDMPTVTIRSWETRYQAITPERTESGHRVYTEENLNDLKWLKKQIHENGLNISQAVHLLKAKKAEETTLELLPDTGDNDPEERFKKQIDELYAAVLELEADKCNRLLDLYFSQFNYHTVFYSIVVPLMYKVGEEWEKGNLHVVKEHMISNIILHRSIRFFSVFETSPNLPRIMAICPQGDHHQLGLILFTLFLREKHYPVYYIGADTPLEGIADLIKEKDINILAISTSRQTDQSLVESYIDSISKINPSLKYLVGGLGIKETKLTNNRLNISPDDRNWEQIMDLITYSS